MQIQAGFELPITSTIITTDVVKREGYIPVGKGYHVDLIHFCIDIYEPKRNPLFQCSKVCNCLEIKKLKF